jgi:hypothetical protein
MNAPESIIITLGPNQSAALAKAAPEFGSCFVLVSRESYPGDPSRYRLKLFPVSVKAASDAYRVAIGEARATRINPKRKDSAP